METRSRGGYKKDTLLAGIGVLLIVLFILTTNPQHLSVGFLLILPILVAYTSYRIIKLMLEVFSGWSSSRIEQISAVLAIGPTLLILLSSLHQLGTQDFVLSTLLVGGLGWYLKRSRAGAENKASN